MHIKEAISLEMNDKFVGLEQEISLSFLRRFKVDLNF